MFRLWSNLVTIVGCVIALISFCFLPYLVVPSTSFAFTGWQLVNSSAEIPLPGYFVYSGVQAVLRNVPLLWAPLLLVILLLLAAGGNSVLPRRDELAVSRHSCVVVTLASLAFTCLLCIWARGAATAFDFMSAHGKCVTRPHHWRSSSRSLGFRAGYRRGFDRQPAHRIGKQIGLDWSRLPV